MCAMFTMERPDLTSPSASTEHSSIRFYIFVSVCICLTIALVVVNAQKPMIPAIILHVFAALVVVVMALQPATSESLSFKVSSLLYNGLAISNRISRFLYSSSDSPFPKYFEVDLV